MSARDDLRQRFSEIASASTECGVGGVAIPGAQLILRLDDAVTWCSIQVWDTAELILCRVGGSVCWEVLQPFTVAVDSLLSRHPDAHVFIDASEFERCDVEAGTYLIIWVRRTRSHLASLAVLARTERVGPLLKQANARLGGWIHEFYDPAEFLRSIDRVRELGGGRR